LAELMNGIISFIGLGSNMDDPQARCLEAIGHLEKVKKSTLLRRSSFYRTEPVGLTNQDWFINAVVELRTALSARELLAELQAIENLMGRSRIVKWGPRVIDLDILLYGQEIIEEADLTVPHREMHKRRFVLEPLYELAPYAIHPAFGVSVAGLRKRLGDVSRVELLNKGQV